MNQTTKTLRMTKEERETENLLSALENIVQWPESDPCKDDAIADYTLALTELLGEDAAVAAIADRVQA